MQHRLRRRWLVVALALALAGAAAAVAVLLTRGSQAAPASRAAFAQARPPSLAARFAVLRHRHSNRCGMPASALDAMPPAARLQGACCFPMNYRAYVMQRRSLKRYAAIDLVPQDPYDVPVRLARRLIAYQRLALSPEQKRTYQRAIPLSETKGPCCCPCWRWTAFGGQAKYLIARRNYTARQIGKLWGLEEGCGGPPGS